jgi:hypothetical protein
MKKGRRYSKTMAADKTDRIGKKLNKLLAKGDRLGTIGCLEYRLGKTKGNYGRYHMCYPNLTPEHPPFRAQMTASRAVYILHERRPDMIAETGTGQVSHRCHNPKCMEFKHLTLETQELNEKRKGCKGKPPKCHGCEPPCIFPTSSTANVQL